MIIIITIILVNINPQVPGIISGTDNKQIVDGNEIVVQKKKNKIADLLL
tara:strand:+ start:1671 stop:1817 length:147 start_codon:yes stop_codon:yes gene_type:complete